MDESDKLLLASLYNDLEFIDDVTSLKCATCSKVAINHVICNCNKLFCSECKLKPLQTCPSCNIAICSLNRTDPEVDDKLCDILVYCPNKKNGCTVSVQLLYMPTHLKKCKFFGGKTSSTTTQPAMPSLSNNDQLFNLFKAFMDQLNLQNTNFQLSANSQHQQPVNYPNGINNMSMQQQLLQQSRDQLFQPLNSYASNQLLQPPNFNASIQQLQQPNLNPSSQLFQLPDFNPSYQLFQPSNFNASVQQLQPPNFNASNQRFQPPNSNASDQLFQSHNFNASNQSLQPPNFNRNNQQFQPPSLSFNRATVAPDSSSFAERFNDNPPPYSQSQMSFESFQNSFKFKPTSNPLKNRRSESLSHLPSSRQEADADYFHESSFKKETCLPLFNPEESYFPDQKFKSFQQNNYNEYKNAIPGKEYNILLLGQTGVGKSTFINGFANYLKFDSIDEAMDDDPLTLIACQFTISDENFKQKTIHFGSDSNESLGNLGQSSTQSCKAYEFEVKNFKICLIDTPGIGDTRGELYGICILLKPNESRLTPSFAFCIKQLLSHLHSNASENICFVFTNSRNTFYRPGDTITPLTCLLDTIRKHPPYPKIPLDKKNIFCLDNEAFRFLIALKNRINFDDEDRHNFSQSWIKSVEESQRLINYIIDDGIAPHNIQDTLSVNQARDAIFNLSRPLSEIAKNIQQNLQVLNQRKQYIQDCQNDAEKLKDQLYMPTVTLEIKELDQPRTVCTGENCREPYQMGSNIAYHYPIRCHDPCYLQEVPRDVVGDEALRHCWCINQSTAICHQCDCHYSKHMQIYYESEKKQTNVVDQNIQSQLDTKEGTLEAAEEFVQKLEEEIKKYEAEERFLTEYTAKLAVFLKQNAMVVRNDSFKEYVTEQIENEKSLAQKGSDNAEVIKGLQNMLSRYEIEKGILDRALTDDHSSERVTAKDVENIISQLSKMKISGLAFKTAYKAQKKLRQPASLPHHICRSTIAKFIMAQQISNSTQVYEIDTEYFERFKSFILNEENGRCVQCKQFALQQFLCDNQHIFCSQCKQDLKEQCTTCNSVISTISSKINTVDEVMTKCIYSDNGCQWVMSIREMLEHEKKCKNATAAIQNSEDTQINYMKSTNMLVMEKKLDEFMLKTERKLNEIVSKVDDIYEVLKQIDGSSRIVNSQLDTLTNYQTPAHSTNLLDTNRMPEVVHDLIDMAPVMAPPSNFGNLTNQMTSIIPNFSQPNPCDNNLEKRQECNILFLGPTGVGKSTFINAFYNYLLFDSLDQAIAGELKYIIPCQFNITDQNFQPREIKLGSDENEAEGNDGRSSTQSCKAFCFPYKAITVRIIDTPGIGDTRGPEQDKENLSNILQFLTNYEYLHAICILLKPNESRLTSTLQFCLSQLLCYLHPSASKNIVFMFTNSRTTSYRPGDTMTPLKEILHAIEVTPPHTIVPLDKYNVFCFDSEAFRFLVSSKQGVKFDENYVGNFNQSWLKSAKASHDMIHYIVEGRDGTKLPPHKIQTTVSTYYIRQSVEDISKPLLDALRHIDDNMKVLTNHTKTMQQCSNNLPQLLQLCFIPSIISNVKEFSYSQMVCTSEKCKRIITLGGVEKDLYTKVCHDRCDAKIFSQNDDSIDRCEKIDYSTMCCTVCGCPASSHKRLPYGTDVSAVKYVDPTTDRQYSSTNDIEVFAQQTFDQIQNRIFKIQQEEHFLIHSMAHLHVFLKDNFLVGVEDHFKQKLIELIEQESSLNKIGANNLGLVQHLQCMLGVYENVSQQIQNKVPKLSANDAQHILGLLYNTEISGELIRTALYAQNKFKKLVVNEVIVDIN
ncbi:hypothetical protein CHUAL_005365 [Chamberlinius hualienensis]